MTHPTIGTIALRYAVLSCAMLMAPIAYAQDAAWLPTPTVAGSIAGTFDFDAAANWGPASVPAGVATFGLSSGSSISFSADSTFGAWTFNPGASSYTFANNRTLQFTGSGITVNGGAIQVVNSGTIEFFNAASAGTAGFSNTLATLNFHGSSTAGNANIVSSGVVTGGGLISGGGLNFFDASSAGAATITINPGGGVQFRGASSAAGATINNAFDVFFVDTATAGHASIINAGATITISGNPVNTNGAAAFFGSSTAGSATIVNGWLGHTLFTDTSSAENATVITNSGGETLLWLNGSGGQARFVTNPGGLFDISGLTSVGTTAGSIEGAGGYSLGAKRLTVGSLNTDTEVGGTIFGAGGTLIKVGTGTLTLSGNNSYTGGTTISAGTLQLGDGGSSGSIQGAITNNGRLAIERADTFVLDNTIAGTGELRQIGIGQTIVTASNSYTGQTTVDGGLLVVNGSIASSSLTTVNAGGTLGGNGFVGNTLINGGTLAPGNPHGALMVQGDLTFTANAAYGVDVSSTNADRTDVFGHATLNGAAVNAVYGSIGGTVLRRYTIMTATGGVRGAFRALSNTGLPPAFRSALSYDANDVYLDLQLSYGNVALNANQRRVGNALGSVFSAQGSISAVFGTLSSSGLAQIDGEAAIGTQQAAFNAMGLFTSLLTDPLAVHASEGSGPAGAIGFAEQAPAAAQASDGRTSKAFAMLTKAPPTASVPHWNVWAAGFGGSQTTDGNLAVGSSNTSSHVYGTAVGADYRLTPNLLAGFALAGGGTNAAVDGLGSGRSDLFQAGAYLRQTSGAAYISAAAAYGWQGVATDRTVAILGIDRLHAEFDANAYSGRLEGGYRFGDPWLGGIGMTPYAAGQFTALALPAYAEHPLSGTDTFALAYAAKTVIDPRTELGLRADKNFASTDGLLILRGRLAWSHDFSPDRSLTAAFQTLPGASFVVKGAAQGCDAALVTGSIEKNWLTHWSVVATFEGEFSSAVRSYAGKGALRYAW
jgi:autotransporter-associated beta strand protein